MTIQVGDIVCPLVTGAPPADPERFKFGVVLDIYEDDYSIVYYEVHWVTESPAEWWAEHELELVSESG